MSAILSFASFFPETVARSYEVALPELTALANEVIFIVEAPTAGGFASALTKAVAASLYCVSKPLVDPEVSSSIRMLRPFSHSAGAGGFCSALTKRVLDFSFELSRIDAVNGPPQSLTSALPT